MHQVDLYKELLRPLRIRKSNSRPKLFLLDEEIVEARALLVQQGHHPDRPLIGMNPGAAYGSAKCWLPDRFSQLASRLLEEDPDLTILFFGDASSSQLIKQICATLPKRAINLAGVTNLRELACLIHDCDLLITNDSGPMHIGAALGTPLVALFGSTDDRATGPYGMGEAVLNKRVSCSPCLLRTCPIDFRCMKEISVEEVFQLALQRKRARV